MRRALLFAAALGVAGLVALRSKQGPPRRATKLKKHEGPHVDVRRREGPIELRRYDGQLVATTLVEDSDFSRASNEGFRRLAGYIFGNNRGGREQIAMTTPVHMEPASAGAARKIAMTTPVESAQIDGSWRMSFFMPHGYSLQTLPEPKDSRVLLEEVPPYCALVYQFSGIVRRGSVARYAEVLRAIAARDGVGVIEPPAIARYDPPFTPPWRRLNEVILRVEPSACET